jgi:hypothetical protein
VKSVEAEADLIEKTSGRHFRNIQHCFNSIRGRFEGSTKFIYKHLPYFSFKQAKIQTIANFFGLKILWRSKSIKVGSEIGNHIDQKDFDKLVFSLGYGAYLVRFVNLSTEGLQKDKKSKGELYGHSIAFIKEGNTGYVFDPNSGAKVAEDDKKVLKKLFEGASMYEFDSFRFYQLEKKGEDLSELHSGLEILDT